MSRLFAAFSTLIPAILQANAGSPGVFLDASAGPYPLSIYVKTPQVIPGVARVEIRGGARGLSTIRLVQTPISGPGTRFAPSPEEMQRSKADPKFFTGSLWLMTPGSWKVHIMVAGDQGPGELFVPIPAAMMRTSTMNYALGSLLSMLGLALIVGAICIAGASVREAHLEPGHMPSRANKESGRLFMLVTAVAIGGLLFAGNQWWENEAERYKRQVYEPLAFNFEIDPDGNFFGSLGKSGAPQKSDDMIPDHGHYMHLFVVSMPAMDKMWHLHPDMQVGGVFTMRMAGMDAGKYQIFGDIVHANGFPETAATEWELKKALSEQPLEGDDSRTSAPPAGSNPDPGTSVLGDKYRMVMVRGNKPVKAGEASHFTFRVETRTGRPAEDLELYMGMPGHAAFIKHDRSVFARVNPSGSAPLAAIQMVSSQAAQPSTDRSNHSMNMGIPAEITFPYGFPSGGGYRIFVQIKRAGKIETGTFDVNVLE